MVQTAVLVHKLQQLVKQLKLQICEPIALPQLSFEVDCRRSQ